MKENNLHAGGQKDYIRDLKKQQESELKKLDKILITEEGKQSLVNKVKAKFKRLIGQSDDALFLKKQS